MTRTARVRCNSRYRHRIVPGNAPCRSLESSPKRTSLYRRTGGAGSFERGLERLARGLDLFDEEFLLLRQLGHARLRPLSDQRLWSPFSAVHEQHSIYRVSRPSLSLEWRSVDLSDDKDSLSVFARRHTRVAFIYMTKLQSIRLQTTCLSGAAFPRRRSPWYAARCLPPQPQVRDFQ